MHHLRVGSTMLAATIAIGGVGAGADTSAAAVRCNKLTGQTVMKTASFKIVKQRIRGDASVRGVRFKGCGLPSGKVRVLGERTDEFDESGFNIANERTRFAQPRGDFVLRHRDGRSGESTAGDSGVLNVRTGKSYGYDSRDSEQTGPGRAFCGGEPRAARLDAQGRLAVLFFAMDGDQLVHAVEAFTSTGARKALDKAPQADIAPASLKSSGGTVSWVNGGMPKSVLVTEETPANTPPDC